MDDKRKTRITYTRLDEDSYVRLEQIAEAEERTVSYLVRIAIEQFLNRRKVA